MRTKIPAIPATSKVIDENPGDGWVAGIDDSSVVGRTSVVLTANDAPVTGGVFTISPTVWCAGSADWTPWPGAVVISAVMANLPSPGDRAE